MQWSATRNSVSASRRRAPPPTARRSAHEAAAHMPRDATRGRPGLPAVLTRHQRAHPARSSRHAVPSRDNRSRGWRAEAGNRTRRPYSRWEGDAWASEAWRKSGAWDGGPDGTATLSGEEVRLALSTSVGASEEASYIDAVLFNWLGLTMRSTHVVLHNDATRRTPLLRPPYL